MMNSEIEKLLNQAAAHAETVEDSSDTAKVALDCDLDGLDVLGAQAALADVRAHAKATRTILVQIAEMLK